MTRLRRNFYSDFDGGWLDCPLCGAQPGEYAKTNGMACPCCRGDGSVNPFALRALLEAVFAGVIDHEAMERLTQSMDRRTKRRVS